MFCVNDVPYCIANQLLLSTNVHVYTVCMYDINFALQNYSLIFHLQITIYGADLFCGIYLTCYFDHTCIYKGLLCRVYYLYQYSYMHIIGTSQIYIVDGLGGGGGGGV